MGEIKLRMQFDGLQPHSIEAALDDLRPRIIELLELID